MTSNNKKNGTEKNGKNGNGVKAYKKTQSRKWRLALLVLLLATFGTFLPPIVSVWIFGASKAMVILSGMEWVSVITMVVGLYIGGNVYQKHVERKHMGTGVSLNASVNAFGDAAAAAPYAEGDYRRSHDPYGHDPYGHNPYGRPGYGRPPHGPPHGHNYGRTPPESGDPAEPFDDSDEGKEA